MHDKQFLRETLLDGAKAFQAGRMERRSFLALCGIAGFASANVLAGRAEAAAGEIVMWNWGGNRKNATPAPSAMPLPPKPGCP